MSSLTLSRMRLQTIGLRWPRATLAECGLQALPLCRFPSGNPGNKPYGPQGSDEATAPHVRLASLLDALSQVSSAAGPASRRRCCEDGTVRCNYAHDGGDR